MNKVLSIFKNIFIRKTIKEINFSLESYNIKSFLFTIKSIFSKNNKEINELENYFQNKLNIKHAIAFDFGRTGLYAIAKSIKKDSELDNIIIPGFSCIVVRNSLVSAGFKVKYADVNKTTFTPDLEYIQKVIDKNTKAIVIQHVFGQIANNIDEIKKEYPSIIIIEDCAHTIESKFLDNSYIGTKGDYSFFSFEQSKPISSFEGGIVVTNKDNSDINKIVTSLEIPQFKDDLLTLIKIVITYIFYGKYIHFIGKYIVSTIYKLFKINTSMTKEELNGNFLIDTHKKLSNYKASIILYQLKNIDNILNHREEIVSSYNQILNYTNSNENVMTLRYPYIVKNKSQILKQLSADGYILGSWFNSPIHPIDINNKPLDYIIGSCPNAQQLCKSIINLPTGFKINKDEALKLGQLIKGYNSNGK
jgi:dTDP-4-amino-4,6-dideoxygalactose transaminase